MRQPPPTTSQRPPIHPWELYILRVSPGPNGGVVSGEVAGTAGATERPEMSVENRGLTYPSICTLSARDEEYFCGFAVDRDGAADDARSGTVLFAHWDGRLG